MRIVVTGSRHFEYEPGDDERRSLPPTLMMSLVTSEALRSESLLGASAVDRKMFDQIRDAMLVKIAEREWESSPEAVQR